MRELELDFRDRELWLRDFGRSAAMAAISEMATGQNHSCGGPSPSPSRPSRPASNWSTTAAGVS